MLRFFVLLCLWCLPAYAGAASTIVVFGDSLSSGYGVPLEKGWGVLLQKRITQNKLDYKVVNASISGETSQGGAYRIQSVLDAHKPAIVILGLGGNDGLRGLPVAAMSGNLSTIIRISQKAGAKVLLLGMRMPPNYGPSYTQEFHATYKKLAEKYNLPLVLFLLEGVADKREWFLNDNIHPGIKAQPIIMQNVWQHLYPMIRGKAPANSKG